MLVTKIIPELSTTKLFPYIVNHSKKQFINKNKDYYNVLHPLPLLTCEGNGRGRGDYKGESNLIGIWARDIISVEREKPTEDFVEILIENLVE